MIKNKETEGLTSNEFKALTLMLRDKVTDPQHLDEDLYSPSFSPTLRSPKVRSLGARSRSTEGDEDVQSPRIPTTTDIVRHFLGRPRVRTLQQPPVTPSTLRPRTFSDIEESESEAHQVHPKVCSGNVLLSQFHSDPGASKLLSRSADFYRPEFTGNGKQAKAKIRVISSKGTKPSKFIFVFVVAFCFPLT